MEAQSSYLQVGSNRWHILTMGEGPKYCIAFHGFGDSAESYRLLLPSMGQDFTIIAIDLPFHGKTQWNSDSYSDWDLIELVNLLLVNREIERFFLMGHSLGGRITLQLLATFMYKLNGIFLLAPDGLHTRKLDQLLIWPVGLQNLVIRFLHKPRWLLLIARRLHKLGILGKFNYRFVEHNLRSATRRERLFGTWVSLRSFKPKVIEIRRELRSIYLPVIVIFGSKDKVIAADRIIRKVRMLPNVQIHILSSGHRVFGQRLNNLLGYILEVMQDRM